MTGFIGQRRRCSEDALSNFVQAPCAAFTEVSRNLVGKFAVYIDQRTFDFDSRHRRRQVACQFFRGGLQLFPESREHRLVSVGELRQCIAERIHALPGRGNDGTDSDATQPALQRVDVDADATGLGRVRHRQRNQ